MAGLYDLITPQEQLDRLESSIRGYSGDTTMSKNQRQGLLGVAQARLGLTADPEMRAGIIDRARGAITGIGGVLDESRLKQMGLLSGMMDNYPSTGLRNLQFRAKGGPLYPNTPTVVGENGPELLYSEQPGYVMPNNVLRSLVNSVSPQTQPASLPFAYKGADPSAVQNVGGVQAYLDNGNGGLAVRETARGDRYGAEALTGDQIGTIQKNWNTDAYNMSPSDYAQKIDVNSIPMQVGGRVGTASDKAELYSLAKRDQIDNVNAGLGLSPATNTPIDNSEKGLAALTGYRANLNKTDAYEASSQLRAEMARAIADQRNDTNMKMLEDRLRSNELIASGNQQARLLAAAMRAGRDGDSPVAQSTFVDPETGKPLVFDKKTGSYRVANVAGGVAPKPSALSPEAAAKAQLIDQALTYIPRIRTGILGSEKDSPVVNRKNVINSAFRTPFTEGREVSTLILDAVEAKLRAESGAAVPEPEVRRIAKRYIPQPGDDDNTIITKINNMESFLKGTQQKINRGRSAGKASPPSGSGKKPPKLSAAAQSIADRY